MRVLIRAALAAAVALAAGAVPAGAASAQRAESVVVVPADGSVAATPLVTPGGAILELTVSGVFAFNARGGLADCGSNDVNDALVGQDWRPGSIGLLVDGARAACASVDAAAHQYTVTVRGTGAPLRLSIADPTGYADNAGGLTVTVRVAIDVDGTCRGTVSTSLGGGGDYDSVVIVAEAHQTGTSPGAITMVTCAVDGGGIASSWSEARPGPAVAAARTATVTPGGSVRLCPTVAVLDADLSVLVQHTLPCT